MGGRLRNDLKTWSTPASVQSESVVACALCGGGSFAPALECGPFRFVRCGRCSLLQQNPQPDRSAVEHRYVDGHGADYLAYELRNEASFLNLQILGLRDAGFPDIETKLLSGPGKPRFLDVGCATGALLDTLRNRGWEAAGAELCAPSAEYAREKRGLDVRARPVEDALFPEASFDVVHASHLIEHLNEPRSFVRTARSLLKDDGILFVATPNASGFQARLFGASWRSAIFDHLYLFSRKTLRRLLEEEGFAVERTATWGGLAAGSAPKPVKRLADRAVKPLGVGDVMMMRARKIR